MPAVAAAQTATPVPDAETVPAATSVPAVVPPAEGYVRLPANTPVQLEIASVLSSKTSKIDEMFPIRLSAPIIIDGKVIVPAGATGEGQVVHAAKARALGKAGELILAARYVACGDVHIGLRGFRLGESGKDNSGAILAAVAVGGLIATPLMFVSGGESIVPVGTPGNARLMSPVDIRMEPTPICAAPTLDAATTPAAGTNVPPDAAPAAPALVQSK
uniref:hypothetical protein n=1 Tax=Sphingomonas bacterium TaxID=1895847 RepID=UPI00260DE84E|nr:hypothetical protein [Sphingomonas bacterium]